MAVAAYKIGSQASIFDLQGIPLKQEKALAFGTDDACSPSSYNMQLQNVNWYNYISTSEKPECRNEITHSIVCAGWWIRTKNLDSRK